MHRGTAGFIGGIVGGVVKLIIDQLAFSINLSSVDTIDMFSQFTSMSYFVCLIAYLIATGILGWIVASIIPAGSINSSILSGTVLGIVIWGLMNIVFSASSVTTPTWSMGVGSFIINIFSHIVLGTVIFYVIGRNKVDAHD